MSSHLFIAESISDTTLLSHCPRNKPPKVFALLMEYCRGPFSTRPISPTCEGTHYRFQARSQYLIQPNGEDEGSHFRGFAFRLLE